MSLDLLIKVITAPSCRLFGAAEIFIKKQACVTYRHTSLMFYWEKILYGKGINIIDLCRKNFEREIKFLVGKSVFVSRIGAAGA